MSQTATQLLSAGIQDIFVQTYRNCSSTTVAGACEDRDPEIEEARRRQRELRAALSQAVLARSRALLALRDAYSMLGTEAGYDAPADLSGATRKLISGVNEYVGLINAASPLVGILEGPVAAVIETLAGEIAEQRQRRRIVNGSRKIREALIALRNGMAREAQVFDRLSGYIIEHRAGTRRALLQAGLISRAEALKPVAESINATLLPNAEQVIGSSVPVQTSIQAVVTEAAEMEVFAARQRYIDSLATLDALVAQHEELEAGRGVSLEDINRVLTRFINAREAQAEAGEEGQ